MQRTKRLDIGLGLLILCWMELIFALHQAHHWLTGDIPEFGVVFLLPVPVLVAIVFAGSTYTRRGVHRWPTAWADTEA